jgi:hypothetical protein
MSRRWPIPLCLALALWPLTGAAAGRLALLVTNDTGLPGEPTLEYTRNDARRMASVLADVGGFDPQDIVTLSDRRADEILDAVHRMTTDGPVGTFVFYYSGHGDAASLHPGGTRLPLPTLLDALRAVHADLRIGIIDACQSGAVTRPKGARPEAPFDIGLAARSEGLLLISSSSADERSFESDEYRGALFTLHWTVGMRGAADANGDGQISLAEAYSYAYAQTLSSTLLSSSGAQHPAFRWELSGRQDVILAQLHSSATLLVRAQEDGDFILLDGTERHVVAEVPVHAGDERRLALSPGAYVVKMRGVRSLRETRLELASAENRVLSASDMPASPMTATSIRLRGPTDSAGLTGSDPSGSTRPMSLVLEGGQYGYTPQSTGLITVVVGTEWDVGPWLFGAEAFFSKSVADIVSIVTPHPVSPKVGLDDSGKPVPVNENPAVSTVVGVEGAALYSWHFGRFAIRVGAALAPLYEEGEGLGLTGGPRLRFDFALTPAASIVATGDARMLVSGHPTIEPWLSYGMGLRVAL